MNHLRLFLEKNWVVLVIAVIAWNLLAAAASVLYRRRKGKLIFAPRPADALFLEKWNSGRSNRNLFTKFGAAHNCLLVAVTPASVIVHLHFPFTLLFLPEIIDLNQTIPRSNILSVQRTHIWFTKTIELIYESPTGKTRSLYLQLKNP